MQDMLIFGETIRAPYVRKLYDMRGVVADREWLETAENFELYYMYRELARNEDEFRHIREFGLRYDITVIPPAKLGKEYVKTEGTTSERQMSLILKSTRYWKDLLPIFCIRPEGRAGFWTYLWSKLKRGTCPCPA